MPGCCNWPVTSASRTKRSWMSLLDLGRAQGNLHGQRPLKRFIGDAHHLAHAAAGNLVLEAVAADALRQVHSRVLHSATR